MTRAGGLYPNGWPARFLDALATDGGWLMFDGVLAMFDDPPNTNTAGGALRRLRAAGLVESRHRMVHWDRGQAGGAVQWTEWRFVRWPDE